jgi:hypothetical protein
MGIKHVGSARQLSSGTGFARASLSGARVARFVRFEPAREHESRSHSVPRLKTNRGERGAARETARDPSSPRWRLVNGSAWERSGARLRTRTQLPRGALLRRSDRDPVYLADPESCIRAYESELPLADSLACAFADYLSIASMFESVDGFEFGLISRLARKGCRIADLAGINNNRWYLWVSSRDATPEETQARCSSGKSKGGDLSKHA